jgi:hypothetical protein
MVGQQRSARGRHEGRPPAVTYDADVAARTNMPRAQTPTSEVHARSYDPIDKWYGRAGGLTTADVAARTDTAAWSRCRGSVRLEAGCHD